MPKSEYIPMLDSRLLVGFALTYLQGAWPNYKTNTRMRILGKALFALIHLAGVVFDV